MAVTQQQVIDVLRHVDDPELHKDLVTLNMVKQVVIDGGKVDITIELTTPACPLKEQIGNDVRRAVSALPGIKEVTVQFTANVQASPQQKAAENNPLPGVRHIIAVGAGKGGVGKSTIAVNVAVGLARQGATVGLLDGDIYGPSLPTLMGLDDLHVRTHGDNMILPFDVHGVKCMTIGKLVEAEKPLIWRGPMAHGAFRQLATQTQWGELDYLVIDLPPGTGDVPLTMAQLLPLTGAVVVCTPQKVAQDDARRAIRMFQQLQVPLLGVVENMSYFIGDDGKEYDIFGRGGAQAMAGQMDVPYLGGVPINMRLRANSDAGTPTANFEDDAQLARELQNVVGNLASQVSVLTHGGTPLQPTISVS
ncbi:MAG: Mrp/NBP35 family ATP-binding protein [Phycisphaeraceae bacterium]|nr:Mrp/NBP35 family ATP-binding protein [Phycisphaeraceae bacterium]